MTMSSVISKCFPHRWHFVKRIHLSPMYSPVQWAGIIECFFIFHLLLVSTSCWKNSPLSELLLIWNTGTHMCRHCIVIIFFRSDGSTVNTFQTFRQDPNSKVYTPLQWRHMGDMVFQTTVNSTMFKSLPRLTKKTHQCIIGHLDSLRKGPAKRKTHFHVMTSYLTRDGDIWTNMVHSPEKEPRTF